MCSEREAKVANPMIYAPVRLFNYAGGTLGDVAEGTRLALLSQAEGSYTAPLTGTHLNAATRHGHGSARIGATAKARDRKGTQLSTYEGLSS